MEHSTLTQCEDGPDGLVQVLETINRNQETLERYLRFLIAELAQLRAHIGNLEDVLQVLQAQDLASLEQRVGDLEWRLQAEREAFEINAGRYSWAYPTEGHARAAWMLLQMHQHGPDRSKWRPFPEAMRLSAGPGQRQRRAS